MMIVIDPDSVSGPLIESYYQSARVVISIIIAILGSYTALDLAYRAQATIGWRSSLWLGSAGIVQGGSIWSMHFIAMLAYVLPGVKISYDFWITIVSLVIPIVLTTLGFFAAKNSQRSFTAIMLAAMLIAVGIGAMHYIGMAALDLSGGIIFYRLKWVLISLLIAMVASIVVVRLAFVRTTMPQRLLAAIVNGALGISGLHYAAMEAVICQVAPADPEWQYPGLTPDQLSIGIATVTFMILCASLMLTAHDRDLERGDS